MRVLVDGYNVTKGDPATAADALEQQREALERRLAVRCRELLGTSAVTIVWDGEAGHGGGSAGGPVDVVYSREGKADDRIVALAEKWSESAAVKVVTDDGGIRRRLADVRGVTFVSRSAVYEAAQGLKPRRKTRGKGGTGGSTIGLPPGANRITEELKGLWLDHGRKDEE
jgi:predicted RNA-binding protein with PIN domain